MAKRKQAAPRKDQASGRKVIDVLDKHWPGFARTVRASVNLRGTDAGFPKGTFGPNARPGLDLLAQFIDEQQRLYPDAPAAKEVARRFLRIIQGAASAAALELNKPSNRHKGAYVTDKRITDAIRNYLDQQALPLKHGAFAKACAALGLDPKKARRHWKKSGGDSYEWNRELRELEKKLAAKGTRN